MPLRPGSIQSSSRIIVFFEVVEGHPEAFLAVVGHVHSKALLFQPLLNEICDGNLVFGQQYSHVFVLYKMYGTRHYFDNFLACASGANGLAAPYSILSMSHLNSI